MLDHRAGFPVAGPLRGVANVARADLTLALLEQYTRLAVILRRHSVPPFRGRPLVTTSCWLGERLVRADAEARRHMVHQYGLVDLVTVWSHNQVEILEDAGFRTGSVRAIPFGVNAEWFTLETGARPIDVLAVGMDAGRDYATLMDAVRGQDVRVLLVCNEANRAASRPSTRTERADTRRVARNRPLPWSSASDAMRRVTAPRIAG